ncbi:caspase family protein [Lewinella sp. W8]|uniref:caspase family protein n=1 Tax=Lewinella sp. W8 TaxID=2528208 RepID=UPI0010687275|nr:caspase family protein [Lewinella sp. W8]MTB52921.1 hypothetical protein [Lewinella sp. W8]
MNGKNYLLIIAIDQYEHHPRLNNSVRDAEEVVDVLTTLYQFNADCVHRVINGEATEEGIDAKFVELIKTIEKEDNLIVYYSGHGYYREEVKEGYWVTVDGRMGKVTDYISNSNLIKYMHQIKAHHLFLMVDSCFSGALVEQIRGEGHGYAYPSRRVFTSGRIENVVDGPQGENSPFAKGVIDFLKGNMEEEVSATAMIADVSRTVRHLGKQQEPMEGRLRNSRDNGGEFYFRRKLSEEDLWNGALAKGEIEDLEEYIKVYPNGNFIADAREAIRRVRARKAWNVARRRNTLDDYEIFITHHGESEFANNARARIRQILNRQKEELEDRKKRAEHEEMVDECRMNYAAAYNKAITLLRKEKYRQAQVELRKCQHNYIPKHPNFIPTIEEIEKQIDICNRKLNFNSFLNLGKEAYRIRDYRTAITQLAQAHLLDAENQEVKRLLSAAKTAEESGRVVKIPDSKKRTNDPPPQKKQSTVEVVKGPEDRNKIVIKPSKKKVSPGVQHTGSRKKATVVLTTNTKKLEKNVNFDKKKVTVTSPSPSVKRKISDKEKREKRKVAILATIGMVLLYIFLCFLFGVF